MGLKKSSLASLAALADVQQCQATCHLLGVSAVPTVALARLSISGYPFSMQTERPHCGDALAPRLSLDHLVSRVCLPTFMHTFKMSCHTNTSEKVGPF